MLQGLLHLIRMIDTKENQVTIELAELRLYPLEDLHEKGCREERDHGHDRIRPFACQAASVRMRSVVETSGDTENSLARFLRDTWMVVEYPGNGSDTYFRLAGDIINCWGQESIFLGRASTNLGIINLESRKKSHIHHSCMRSACSWILF
jgi:hypothetical protein